MFHSNSQMLNCLLGGPASQAGVQAGDCIVKVNGTPVAKFNHKEVVQIIKCKFCIKSSTPGSQNWL